MKRAIISIAMLTVIQCDTITASPMKWYRNRWVNQYLLELTEADQAGQETGDFVPFINLFKKYGYDLEKIKNTLDSLNGHRFFDLKDKYIRIAGGYWNPDELVDIHKDIYKFGDRFDNLYGQFKKTKDQEDKEKIFIQLLENLTYLKHIIAYGRPLSSASESAKIMKAIKRNPQLMKPIDILNYHMPYDYLPK